MNSHRINEVIYIKTGPEWKITIIIPPLTGTRQSLHRGHTLKIMSSSLFLAITKLHYVCNVIEYSANYSYNYSKTSSYDLGLVASTVWELIAV